MAEITVQTTVNASIEDVWHAWNAPEDIERWCTASDDWATKDVSNDLRVGGRLKSTMFAKDGSASFDLIGTYVEVTESTHIAYTLEDGRAVRVTFDAQGEDVKIIETFDAESENPEDFQRAGWQAILDSFKRYVERDAPDER